MSSVVVCIEPFSSLQVYDAKSSSTQKMSKCLKQPTKQLKLKNRSISLKCTTAKQLTEVSFSTKNKSNPATKKVLKRRMSAVKYVQKPKQSLKSITESIESMIDKELCTPHLHSLVKELKCPASLNHQSDNPQDSLRSSTIQAQRFEDRHSVGSKSMMNRYMTVSTFDYFDSEPQMENVANLKSYQNKLAGISKSRCANTREQLYVEEFMEMLRINKAKPTHSKVFMPHFTWKDRLIRMKNIGNYGSNYKQKAQQKKPPLIRAVSKNRVQTLQAPGHSRTNTQSSIPASKTSNGQGTKRKVQVQNIPKNILPENSYSESKQKRCHTVSSWYHSRHQEPSTAVQESSRVDRPSGPDFKDTRNLGGYSAMTRYRNTNKKQQRKFMSMSNRNDRVEKEWTFQPWDTDKRQPDAL